MAKFQHNMSATLVFLYGSAFDGQTGAFKVRTNIIADIDQCGLITDQKIAEVNRELYASGLMVTHIGQTISDQETDCWGNTGYLVVQHVQHGLQLREYCKSHVQQKV